MGLILGNFFNNFVLSPATGQAVKEIKPFEFFGLIS
jgi:hypothetical protein